MYRTFSRKLAVMAGVAAAVALSAADARAGSRNIDPTIKAVAIGAGAASTAAYFAINDWSWKWSAAAAMPQATAVALTTIGCAAASPMVATAVLRRPLKYREAHILVGSCVVPLIGGWLVNEAYETGLITAPDEPPVRKASARKRR